MSCRTNNSSYAYLIYSAALTAITNEAKIVLVSHGKNGKGAWTRNGSGKITASSDTAEAENSDDDYVFVQKAKTSTFDDIVRYKTLNQLVAEGKGINYSSTYSYFKYLCTIASTITTTTAATFCGSSSPATCATYLGAFATQVTNMCF
jgi:hypothetical protein